MSDDYDYSEPWPMFADEDRPWTDFDRLYRLREKMDTQKEMASALGCTPSTISTWLSKLPDRYQPEPDDESLKCEYWDVCYNTTPAPRNGLCDTCLVLCRQTGHDGADAPMEELYQEYADLVAEYEAEAKQSLDEGGECDDCGEEIEVMDEQDVEISVCPNCGVVG